MFKGMVKTLSRCFITSGLISLILDLPPTTTLACLFSLVSVVIHFLSYKKIKKRKRNLKYKRIYMKKA
jgi:hypothetical protein